ncbi:MAG: hypothetical protein WCT31_02515 [Candidatus Micrarchaeia archaeon]|jgi:hypothetical protein
MAVVSLYLRTRNKYSIRRDLGYLEAHGAARTFATYAMAVPSNAKGITFADSERRRYADKLGIKPESLSKATILYAGCNGSYLHSMLDHLLSNVSTHGLAVNAVLGSWRHLSPRERFDVVNLLEQDGLLQEAAILYNTLYSITVNSLPSVKAIAPEAQAGYERAIGQLVLAGFEAFPLATGSHLPPNIIRYSPQGNGVIADGVRILTVSEALIAIQKPYTDVSAALVAHSIGSLPSAAEVQALTNYLEWVMFSGAYDQLPQAIMQVSHLATVVQNKLDVGVGKPSDLSPESLAMRKLKRELAFMNVETFLLSGNLLGALNMLDNIRKSDRFVPELD